MYQINGGHDDMLHIYHSPEYIICALYFSTQGFCNNSSDIYYKMRVWGA